MEGIASAAPVPKNIKSIRQVLFLSPVLREAPPNRPPRDPGFHYIPNQHIAARHGRFDFQLCICLCI
jgi:hypothetical protein